MSWGSSILIMLLTGVVAMVVSGLVGGLAVDWYRVSSFEGGAGYLVVSLALMGLIGGLVIGLVVSRLVPDAGFLKGLAYAQGVTLGIIALIGGTARLLADVPPRLDGEALLLAVEIRWPDGAALPEESDEPWSVRLSALSGRTARTGRSGPLWREDARQEDGHWVVPGAVEVFTSRGERLLHVEPAGVLERGFLVPLPAYPRRKHLEWSAWLPEARAGAPAEYQYRFKVVPRTQTIRTQTFGPFVVETVAWGFNQITYGSGGSTFFSAAGTFVVRYGGEPLTVGAGSPDGEAIRAVAVVPGPRPALLVRAGSRGILVVADPGGLHTEDVGYWGVQLSAPRLAHDTTATSVPGDSDLRDGVVDDRHFSDPGLYLFDEAVLDTRTLAVERFNAEALKDRLIAEAPPLGVSPDERSFARLRYAGASSEQYEVAVADLVSGEVYAVPYTGPSLRAADYERLDGAWLDHYFRWVPGTDGADRLVAREGVAPMVRRGKLTEDGSGYREYRVWPVERAMRTALVDFLVDTFGAERVVVDEAAFSHEVRIDGATVYVNYNEYDDDVAVWMARGADSPLVTAIAEQFDRALATRRYDGYFKP